MITKLYQNERFEFIKGYNNKYLISNYGRVFNLHTFKFLEINMNSKGYPRVELYSGTQDGIRQRKMKFLHLLVVEHFGDCNGNTFEDMDYIDIINVDHLDKNRKNCRKDNLEIVSAHENQLRKNYTEDKLNKLLETKKINLEIIF